MARIKLDLRIKELINGAVSSNHRAMLVVIGDGAKKQVPILHHIMLRAKGNPADKLPVLWIRKKDAGIGTKKQLKLLQKKINRGQLNFDEDDPLELFLASNVVRYCHYNETQRVLGQTYGMCILQDFEAMTPNVMARTIETVAGGGLVIILLHSVKSLQQIYSMEMDVHSHYRTESHSIVTGRFNERFVLSLADCPDCLVTDDHLSILPMSPFAFLAPSLPTKQDELNQVEEREQLKRKLVVEKDLQSFDALLDCCVTTDQGNAIAMFIQTLLSRASPSTVITTAARGRGKSAVLGLGLACAVALGYSRIIVTAPSPENLSTVFEFLCRGLDALQYQINKDYDVTRSDLPEFNKAIVNVTIFKGHHQTVQYIEPTGHERLGRPDILCIDEAAAIPLPLVKKLIGPYFVLMSSTVSGYEGTGRSLSMKLINDMRQQSVSRIKNHRNMVAKQNSGGQKTTDKSSSEGLQVLYEITLQHPVRYSDGDRVEQWLQDLLCLNVSDLPPNSSSYPTPAQCKLYYINRDTLFSHHKKTEAFLKRLVAVYVSSHYKNTPNDLQMLADAPAHHVFCLIGPEVRDNDLPQILCVLQVAFEGQISVDSVKRNLQRGDRASGDMIPWTIEQQFDGYNFARKSGLRIVRIATHPDYQGMGYGSRTLELLQDYYEDRIPRVETNLPDHSNDLSNATGEQTTSLLCEEVLPKDNLPPLLVSLNHRAPENLDYIGVSYGINAELLKFWKKFGMLTVYIRQTPNDMTGEHSCIMLKRVISAKDDEQVQKDEWLREIWTDFRKRFLRLLSHDFRLCRVSLALDLIHHHVMKLPQKPITSNDLQLHISDSDLQRLEKYSDNLVDYRLIKDLIQPLASLYFCRHLDLHLNAVKSAILLGIGLQGKSVDDLANEFDSKERNFSASQVLGLLHQVIKAFAQLLAQYLGCDNRQVLNPGVTFRQFVKNLRNILPRTEQKKNYILDDKLKDKQVSLTAEENRGTLGEKIESEDKPERKNKHKMAEKNNNPCKRTKTE